MKKLLTVKNLLLLLLGIFIIMQLFRIEKDNPVAAPSNDLFAVLEASAEVRAIVRDACYDCHSYETSYPWYSNIAPVSWMLADHINEGREHLNFSIWGEYPAKKASHKLEECFEEVAKSKMPLDSYTWTHEEARLTEAQRAKLVAWFKKSKKLIDSKKDS